MAKSAIQPAVWAQAEEVFARSGTLAAAAQMKSLGYPMSNDAVLNHMKRRQIEPGVEFAEPTEAEVIQVADLRKALVHTQRQLAKAKERTDDLVAATIEAAREATLAAGPVSPVEPPPKDTRKRPEAALWHMTDWQFSKVTPSYNSVVARERVMRFCQKAARITEIQRADHPVKHCVIAFGGDMVEGLFNFPSQSFEIDATLFEQFVKVARLEVDVVRYALSIYETVEVVAEWGNHGRIGSKRDAVPRNDNVDRMSYELARQLLAGESRLKWEDCPEDIQRIEIGPYRALLIHSDEVGRNGFASPMTIVQHVNRWRSGSYPWDFKDVYAGHYHTNQQFAMANGEGNVYMTGSTESENRYAGVMLAAAARPSQRLHFISDDHVSAQYQVWLGG